jgi:hypothetical protein
MIGDAVFRCWRPSHSVYLREEPANKIPIRHFALINIAAVSLVVISAPIASPGRGSCFRRQKILLTGAASESTVVTEPATPGNQSIRGHDRVYLDKWK